MRSGDAFRSCSLRHDAAAATFPAAQAFDELGYRRARLDAKANEITLCDDATVMTAQTPHHDHPAWTLHDVTHCAAAAAEYSAKVRAGSGCLNRFFRVDKWAKRKRISGCTIMRTNCGRIDSSRLADLRSHVPHTLTRGTFGTELPRGVSLRRGPDCLRRGVDRRFALARRGSGNFSCRGFTGPSG